MEARVDVRKLQVLNDRINQTIDALNQVRLSVHGLGHTGGVPPQVNPFFSQLGQGLGPSGLGQPGLGMPGMFGGLGHTGNVPPQLNPLTYLAQQGFAAPGIFAGQPTPFIQQGIPGFGTGFGLQHTPYQPYMNPLVSPVTNPWGTVGGIGTGVSWGQPEVLEKTLVEARASDPYRITQTFPFAAI